MLRTLFTLFVFSLLTVAAHAQSRQDLEKESEQLKKEIADEQLQLKKNRQNTKQSISDYAKVKTKFELQTRLINNINRQLAILDDTITKSQHDIRRYQLVLDTLKEQYARSMVYSYKNRSNSDFLNFIFSANSFNDAMKRISYLRNYRNYRQMQRENILRTQVLLHQKINTLNDNKEKKNAALVVQSKQKEALADQQKEKAEIVEQLKVQGKQLTQEMAAKKKQMQKVKAALALAIKEAIAKAKADADKAKKEAAARAAAAAKAAATSNPSTVSNAPAVKTPAPLKPATTTSGNTATTASSVLLNADKEYKLNANFISNRGGLPWPVDKGFIIMHYGLNELPGKIVIDNPGLTIGADIGAMVKAIFDGEVTMVSTIGDMQMVVLKHGAYFSAYSNLSNVQVSKGQAIHTGQVIGKVSVNDEGNGSIDFIISTDKGNENPESWLRRK